MAQATLFKNNKNQAIRLPKSMEFPAEMKKVEITTLNDGLLITPLNHVWDSWFTQNSVSNDFMNEREQELQQEREEF